jgi:hypothetical protein
MKYILCLFFLITMWSCDKSVLESVVEPYAPTKVDEAAGNWKTFVLSSPSEVAVPALNSDAAYKKEVDSVKALEITADQKAAIQYWGSGAVLRWNEIGRELAAKYNLPPAANAAGVYPVPNPADPLADPKFPFANPPYTARALAYLSVAQYDAVSYTHLRAHETT